ncbi:hypothetical protein FDJ58_gp072 [Bacillus phage SIOphi]|uniref:Uncharacterized protein n=1 Tax=Bacillus phage SIOphi TaxID=1285382 RepID=R4JMN0_9CAUD|nr:hypothetical protein FDJ58_gp072 [Bacillus phage SIOphi]AGK86880.1 hypothetical protein SIOphi_00360 [Bacillus phage SIOphi]
MTLNEYKKELEYLESIQEDYMDELADLQDALDSGNYDTEEEKKEMEEDVKYISYRIDELYTEIEDLQDQIIEAEQIGAGLSDTERQMKMNGISQSDFI